jgi:tetratricopeptide (TPR) repeat protein
MEQQGNYERAIFNYEQALSLDPAWHVAYFGLSQIYYQMSDEKKGDHFFYLFEQAAPFNVYGNFETHRKLCQEFLEDERFAEAEAAIQALSEWWQENKGACPTEIQIYELLALSRISEAQGDSAQADTRRTRAAGLALSTLDDPKTPEGVLYFIAKVFEEFNDFPLAVRFYKRILKAEGGSPGMVQRIGSQFLSLGEFRMAKELFEEAYEAHPEHPDIRFCLLVANLKLGNVNVEEYLIGRERLRQLVDSGGDKVELLALLHSLMAKFAGDPDVQGHVADVYLKLGNTDRAGRHYDSMYALDPKNRQTALKHAGFVMQYRDPERAMAILSAIDVSSDLPTEAQAEIFWLKSNYFARKKDYRESLSLLRNVLAIDPWNVSYLVQEIINLMQLAPLEPEQRKADAVLLSLSGENDAKVDWQEFDVATKRMEDAHAYALVYARRKLRYLYANGAEDALIELVRTACRFDATAAVHDFMKLLNTNFDSYNIYWALGTMFKELWQLVTASVWFEQLLLYPSLPTLAKAKAYLELADCYIWQNRNMPKAIEYAKLALDLDEKKDARSLRVLAHAYLKAGHVRQAKLYLDQADEGHDHEVRYLKGLLLYRNGASLKANEIWKPLLTVRSESLRFHNIKQEVLKYYFDGAPYLKAN